MIFGTRAILPRVDCHKNNSHDHENNSDHGECVLTFNLFRASPEFLVESVALDNTEIRNCPCPVGVSPDRPDHRRRVWTQVDPRASWRGGRRRKVDGSPIIPRALACVPAGSPKTALKERWQRAWGLEGATEPTCS